MFLKGHLVLGRGRLSSSVRLPDTELRSARLPRLLRSRLKSHAMNSSRKLLSSTDTPVVISPPPTGPAPA